MSRYINETNSVLILSAASHWRDAALIAGGSVFSDKRLWTTENLDSLRQYFVERPDVGQGTFLGKLQEQLTPTPPGAKQLAAEIMWLMYLCPSSLTPRRKQDVVHTLWSWSGEAFSSDTRWLDDNVLTGIGSAGPGFNQNQWRELAFVINFMLEFRKLDKAQQTKLLADPWAFAEWLKIVPEWEMRQFRHMMLYLLFPDEFERIFGQRDRKAVVRAFSDLDVRAINALDAVALDRKLREIRRTLEAEYGTTELDFYLPPLHDRWARADFSAVSNAVTEEHVRMALADIDRDGAPASAQSTGYDLIEAGRRYPPKLVFAIAAKHATGQELDRAFFGGGHDTPAFKVLQKLGFEISTKDLIAPLVNKFVDQAKGGSNLTVRGYLDEYRGLVIRVSFGQGNFARIPWIAFLGKEQTVSNGIYPVLLLFREDNVLLLCYGISETNAPERSWEAAPGEAKTVSAWFAAKFGRAPDRYGQSYVRAAYELDKPLPIEDLKNELDVVIDQYEEILGEPVEPGMPPEPLPTRLDLGATSRSFALALKNSFVEFGASHDSLVSSFIASVVTKPLVILAGLSGSGKTQIALKFGQWLGKGRLHVSAVRPDWTGAESLFGYEDGLKPAVDGRTAWVVPAPLEFMLTAANDPFHPHLLLLDEMNLAHVERYFADVLSGMESGEACLPNLVKGADGIWRIRAQGPDYFPFPRNLWIVGTVNIDETTYMFSPKVLDRANTFEFRVDVNDLKPTVQKPENCSPGDVELVRGILSIARDDKWQQTNPSPYRDELAIKLKQLHIGLARYGMEFGHRVFYESLRFAALAHSAGLGTMEQVLDRIVMQKVLPRLHGSRRRLERPLLLLMQFCRDLPEAFSGDEKLPELKLDQPGDVPAKLPISYNKLCRMMNNLRTNQFASFTE